MANLSDTIVADLKVVYEEVKPAKALLDRSDKQQLEAWGALDRAQVRLEGLATILPHA